MVNEKHHIQLLLEIALNQRVEGDIETSLARAVRLYMRKLNCFAAAVFAHAKLHLLQPRALADHTLWQTEKAHLTTLFCTHPPAPFHYQKDDH